MNEDASPAVVQAAERNPQRADIYEEEDDDDVARTSQIRPRGWAPSSGVVGRQTSVLYRPAKTYVGTLNALP